MASLEDRFIWPMGAELPKPSKLEGLWDNPNYFADMKIRGERLTIVKVSTGLRLYTRSGSKAAPNKPIEVTHRWPAIQSINCDCIPMYTVLDGEAFSPLHREQEIAGFFNYRVREDNMPGSMKFIMFDVPFLGERSLEKTPWIERRALVEELVDEIYNPLIDKSICVGERCREFFDSIIASGGEGVVLKHTAGTYQQGKKPANIWVKAKMKETYDCVITGFKPGEGKYKNMIGSVYLAQYKRMPALNGIHNFKLVTVCASSGMPDELRQDMTDHPDDFIGQVVIVDGYERSNNGITIIQPRIKFVRPEGSKDPRACIIEDEKED